MPITPELMKTFYEITKPLRRKRKPYTPSLGSISSDTLRNGDLLEAFLDELCAVAPREHGELKREARRAMRDLNNGSQTIWSDNATEIVDDLQDALFGHAPPFMWFGAHEGDGADFGWWPSWEDIDELPAFEDTGKAAEARFVGEFKTVSDHGNVEVYVRYGNGRIKSVLGIV